MGKITDALKKAAEERFNHLEKIARIKEQDRLVIKRIQSSKIDPAVLAYFDPKSVISEQYKILRTNIMSMNKGKPPKVFVVTSSLHSEGKTVTSLNLAITMANAVNKPKILIVDADLRRGRIQKDLGVNHPVGLSEVLTGEAKLEDALFNIDIDNLTFISCGHTPDNPSELLASQRMEDFLNDVRRRFDFVIIDTPPIISVTDSGIVGAQTDGVFMVVQAGRTQRGIIRRAEELLHQSHSNILGHILTNIEYHLPEYIYRYL
jgi:capsular exopolysaccharide synthesis family protein